MSYYGFLSASRNEQKLRLTTIQRSTDDQQKKKKNNNLNKPGKKWRNVVELLVLLALKQFAQRMETIAALFIARCCIANVAECIMVEFGCRYSIAYIGHTSTIHRVSLS